MSEMVDRVARAIAEAKIRAHGGKPFDPYTDLARAAITAMREPTDPMLWGVSELMSTEISPWCGTLQGVAWTKMVDAALKD